MIKPVQFYIIYFLIGICGLYILFDKDTATPLKRPFSEFPATIKGWQMIHQSDFSEDVLNVLRPTDYLNRQYSTPDGRVVNLYLGFHSGGNESGGIHSPKHCLPGSGWYEFYTSKASIEVGTKKINLVRAIYQQGDMKELFLYWFQIRQETLSDEYALKFAEIKNSITRDRRDSTFIRVSVPFDSDVKNATALGIQFIRDIYPVIVGFLPT
jgi:EpsI family protein